MGFYLNFVRYKNEQIIEIIIIIISKLSVMSNEKQINLIN